jgi:hypothetical protein
MNDEAYTIDPVEVCQITYFQNINKVEEENINPVYLAQVKVFPDGKKPYTTSAYVKFIDQWGVYAEVFCALIGRSIGLPVPKPMLAYLSPELTPPKDCFKGSSTLFPCFASEDMQHPSIRKLIKADKSNGDRIISEFMHWHKVIDTCAFDELIMNADRQVGNLLYENSKSFVLIDHEKALDQNKDYGACLDNNIMLNVFLGMINDRSALINGASSLKDAMMSAIEDIEKNNKSQQKHFVPDSYDANTNSKKLYNRAQILPSIMQQQFSPQQGNLTLG